MLDDAISRMDRREAYGPTPYEVAMEHTFGAIAELLTVVEQKDRAIAAMQSPAQLPQRQQEIFL